MPTISGKNSCSPVTSHEAFIALRKELAAYYEDEARARRVAFDANLKSDNIDFSGPAIDMWHAILQEAEKADKTAKLFKVVQSEYSTLKNVCDAYQTNKALNTDTTTSSIDLLPETRRGLYITKKHYLIVALAIAVSTIMWLTIGYIIITVTPFKKEPLLWLSEPQGWLTALLILMHKSVSPKVQPYLMTEWLM
jgi:hypothetical protein